MNPEAAARPGRRRDVSSTTLKIESYRAEVADRPGEALRVLMQFKEAGVGFLAVSCIARTAGTVDLELVPDHEETFRRVAARIALDIRGPERCFLFQDGDRVGAVADNLAKLATRGIPIVSCHAVTGGGGRWGMLLHVGPADFDRAAEALGF
jgi:hypothetical protein